MIFREKTEKFILEMLCCYGSKCRFRFTPGPRGFICPKYHGPVTQKKGGEKTEKKKEDLSKIGFVTNMEIKMYRKKEIESKVVMNLLIYADPVISRTTEFSRRTGHDILFYIFDSIKGYAPSWIYGQDYLSYVRREHPTHVFIRKNGKVYECVKNGAVELDSRQIRAMGLYLNQRGIVREDYQFGREKIQGLLTEQFASFKHATPIIMGYLSESPLLYYEKYDGYMTTQ